MEQLIAKGRTNVFNIEGSIFAWANEDRPLESNRKPASKVHPFSAKWGRLLKEERRAELPPPAK